MLLNAPPHSAQTTNRRPGPAGASLEAPRAAGSSAAAGARRVGGRRSHGGRRYLPWAFTEHGALMADA